MFEENDGEFYIRDTERDITIWPAELAADEVPDGYDDALDHFHSLDEGHYIGLNEEYEWYINNGAGEKVWP